MASAPLFTRPPSGAVSLPPRWRRAAGMQSSFPRFPGRALSLARWGQGERTTHLLTFSAAGEREAGSTSVWCRCLAAPLESLPLQESLMLIRGSAAVALCGVPSLREEGTPRLAFGHAASLAAAEELLIQRLEFVRVSNRTLKETAEKVAASTGEPESLHPVRTKFCLVKRRKNLTLKSRPTACCAKNARLAGFPPRKADSPRRAKANAFPSPVSNAFYVPPINIDANYFSPEPEANARAAR